MMDIWQSIGLLGAGCIVYAYWQLQRGNVTSTSRQYYLFNLFGATLLFISLLVHFNLGSILIEAFWIWISVKGLVKSDTKGK